MSFKPAIYRIFDTNGTKLSTAICSNEYSFLQVKPKRSNYASQMEWARDVTNNGRVHFTITREELPFTKRWADMTQKERQEHLANVAKKAVERKNKEIEALRVKRQAESPFTKQVRALYNEYNLSDSLQIKNPLNIRVYNPKLQVLTEEGDMYPVYFNRKTGNVLVKDYASKRGASTIDPTSITNAPYTFFIQESYGMRKAKLPVPDTRMPSPDQKSIGFIYSGSLSETRKTMISDLEKQGYFVRTLSTYNLYRGVEEIEINYPEIETVIYSHSWYFDENKVKIFRPKEFQYRTYSYDLKTICFSSWLAQNPAKIDPPSSNVGAQPRV